MPLSPFPTHSLSLYQSPSILSPFYRLLKPYSPSPSSQNLLFSLHHSLCFSLDFSSNPLAVVSLFLLSPSPMLSLLPTPLPRTLYYFSFFFSSFSLPLSFIIYYLFLPLLFHSFLFLTLFTLSPLLHKSVPLLSRFLLSFPPFPFSLSSLPLPLRPLCPTPVTRSLSLTLPVIQPPLFHHLLFVSSTPLSHAPYSLSFPSQISTSPLSLSTLFPPFSIFSLFFASPSPSALSHSCHSLSFAHSPCHSAPLFRHLLFVSSTPLSFSSLSHSPYSLSPPSQISTSPLSRSTHFPPFPISLSSLSLPLPPLFPLLSLSLFPFLFLSTLPTTPPPLNCLSL